MHHPRFMAACSSLSIIWVMSIAWLIIGTPLVSTAVPEVTSNPSPVISDIQEYQEPTMSMGLLSDSNQLQKGINMAWYTNTETTQFTLEDDSVVEEDITPYWFSIGYDPEIVQSDLDALQKMGVRHVRITALIFQFVVWDEEYGSLGLNGSIMNIFDSFLQEIQNRGMVLTVTFLGPYWTYSEHPSLMKYFKIFSDSSGMDEWALHNLQLSMVDFAEYYKDHSEIHTWELVSDFSSFTDILSSATPGFGLNINATKIFDFIESVAEEIRAVDDLHLVIVSDGWPPDFEEDWWTSGLVPIDYEGRLRNLTDYIALCYYSDGLIPDPTGERMKYGGIVEIASTQLYNYSREQNIEILLNAYVEAINKSYSVFCPWEFSENIVLHEETGALSNHNRHDWTWDALLLYSLYRNDSLKFINTTNWYVLSTEPELDNFGRMSFTLFHRAAGAYPPPYGFGDGHFFDPAEGGTIVTVLSPNLLIGEASIMNRQSSSDDVLYGREELGVCDYITTKATINSLGYVLETGIQVESDHTWEALVERYDDNQISLQINTTGPAEIKVETGNFTLFSGYTYMVSFRDLFSGDTWNEILRADENRTIRIDISSNSIVIKINLDTNSLGVLSVGTSISVIIISIVIYYYFDKRTPKK